MNIRKMEHQILDHTPFDALYGLLRVRYEKKVFHVTGKVGIDRKRMRSLLLRRYGAYLANRFSNKINYLMIGEEGSNSKIKRAQELGVQILSKEERDAILTTLQNL